MGGIIVLFLVFALGISHMEANTIPTKCQNPSGSSCEWYPNCLEKNYPCENSNDPYALSFAYKYCKLYDARKGLFSADELKWVNGVRKCLQVALAPVLKQTTTPSCQEIRNKGFQSHAGCYVSPGSGAPSICKLGCDVYIKVFRVIKGSLSWSTFWEMVKASWYISRKCGFSCSII